MQKGYLHLRESSLIMIPHRRVRQDANILPYSSSGSCNRDIRATSHSSLQYGPKMKAVETGSILPVIYPCCQMASPVAE
eukprot:6191732-Pleurochrysis_carterae.AAC.4